MKKYLNTAKRNQYLFFFFTGAFTGYLWEVVLLWITEHQWVNRGFFYGPWLPVYGVGAVLYYLLLQHWQHAPLMVFCYSLLIGSSLEYFIGFILDKIWGLHYWDYSNELLNLNGYVCLYSAVGFGLAGMLWICYVSKYLLKYIKKIPARTQDHILIFLLLVFFIDLAAALIFPNKGLGITF